MSELDPTRAAKVRDLYDRAEYRGEASAIALAETDGGRYALVFDTPDGPIMVCVSGLQLNTLVDLGRGELARPDRRTAS